MPRRYSVVLLCFFLAPLAEAQTASSSGIMAQGRICLDLAGNFDDANPPPEGTRVIATDCSGRPSQRWETLYGDYDYLLSVGSHRLVYGFPTPRGETLNVGGPRSHHGRAPVYDDQRHVIATSDERCVTRSGIDVFVAPCSGSPEQEWELR